MNPDNITWGQRVKYLGREWITVEEVYRVEEMDAAGNVTRTSLPRWRICPVGHSGPLALVRPEDLEEMKK